MKLQLNAKKFSYNLTKKLITANGIIHKKTGLLLRLSDTDGRTGWGEVSPIIPNELKICEKILNSLGPNTTNDFIEEKLPEFPGSLAFGLGASLGELNNSNTQKINFENLEIPNSSFLLPTDMHPLKSIIDYITQSKNSKSSHTVKWKVSNKTNHLNDKKILKEILDILPENYKLRIDPNGSWTRQQAEDWVHELQHEPRLEWIEQPLQTKDIEGLFTLANQIPIALDESLVAFPVLRKIWKAWQIRRPILDGDPRLLLEEIEEGANHIVISTAFETGIGIRWINLLAAKQSQGAKPCAPGLAPGWRPKSRLFSLNPKTVWEAA